MIAFKEFIVRSMEGPIMTELEFDLKLSRILRELAADYNVHFRPEEIICDDSAADAIFQAATELLGQAGVYNVDTNRAIILSQDEIKGTVRETPHQFTRGGGKDAVTVAARQHNSKTPPYVFRDPLRSHWHPGMGTFLSEMIEAYDSDKSALGRLARELKPALANVPHKAGTVGEMVWAEAMARWKLATARAMGKPDMFLGLPDVIGVPAFLACLREDLYQKHHSCVPIHIMPELKINWERLTLAFAARGMGVARWNGTASVLGGYARNAEETAICIVATLLAQLSYGAADWASCAPIDRQGHRTTRPTLQAHSGACRAVSRNIGVPIAGIQLTKHGLGTDIAIFEEAAAMIQQTCSGIAWTWFHLCHPGPDGQLKGDLDGELVMKLAKAVAGMERDQASELVNKVLALYESRWEPQQKGRPFAYYYDLKTLTPAQELVDLYRRAEEKLAALGVPLA